VLFRQWFSAEPEHVLTVNIERVEPYRAGEFYKRELPLLIAVLNRVAYDLKAIVVDGYAAERQ
jgi:deoxyribonuclease V